MAGQAGSAGGSSSSPSVGASASFRDFRCRDSRSSTHFGTSSTSQCTPYLAGLDLVATRFDAERSDFPNACAAVCSLPTDRPPGRPTHGSSSDGGVRSTRGGGVRLFGPVAARVLSHHRALIRRQFSCGDASGQPTAYCSCIPCAFGDLRDRGKHLQCLQVQHGQRLGAASQESASASGMRSAKHLAPSACHDCILYLQGPPSPSCSTCCSWIKHRHATEDTQHGKAQGLRTWGT